MINYCKPQTHKTWANNLRDISKKISYLSTPTCQNFIRKSTGTRAPNIHGFHLLDTTVISKENVKTGLHLFSQTPKNTQTKIHLYSHLQQHFISSANPCSNPPKSNPKNRGKTKMELNKNNSAAIKEELPGFVTLYEDGSIKREETPNILTSKVPCNSDCFINGVSTTDVTLDQTTGLWARIFLPEEASATGKSKLPVVLYFHGGGFCTGDPSWQMFHDLCSRLSIATGSIWVSVGYRLAPEHRLPASCEDCISALDCIDRPGFETLSSRGDLGLLFLAGDSVGANLAHQVALSAGRNKILGVILMHPGLVKEEKSRSEIENGADLALVSIDAVEKGSRLSLPEGENKDYYVMNPLIPSVGEVLLPPVIVLVGKMDIFYDRQIEYCKEMGRVGQDVELVEYAEMGHCFFNYPQNENCPEAKDFVEKIVRFMERCGLRAQSCRGGNVGIADAI